MIETGRVVGVEITAEDKKPNLEDHVARKIFTSFVVGCTRKT